MIRSAVRVCLSILLLASFSILIFPAGAQEAKAKKAGKSPQAKPAATAADPANNAKAILDKMSAFYNGTKTIKVNARTQMKMKMQGMNMDVNGTSVIAAERPNKFSSVSKGEGMMAMALSNTIVSDGTNMVVYMPMMQSYTEQEAPADFSGIVGNSAGGAGAEAFIIGMLSSESSGASLFEGVENAKYIGLEDLNGTQCHHLQLASMAPGLDTMGMGNMKMDMWVEAGEKPYLRKVTPDFGSLLSQLGGGGGVFDDNAKTCQSNLNQIAGMKEQYALEHSAKAGTKVTKEQLQKLSGIEIPKCPSGEGYALNAIGQEPLCLSGLEGHDLASAATAKELEGIEGLEGMGDVGAMLQDMEMEMTFEYEGWESDTTLAPEIFTFAPPEGAKKTDDLFGDLGVGDMGNLGGLGVNEESDPAKQLEGKPAPTFKLALAGGGEFDLAQHLGKKVVILDFWATWCGPCRKSMPTLIKIADEYAAKGVVFTSINLEESEEDVIAFLKKENWKVSVALDSDYSVGELYMAEAIPETVIIGKDGNVASVHVGLGPNFEAELRATLDELLAAK